MTDNITDQDCRIARQWEEDCMTKPNVWRSDRAVAAARFILGAAPAPTPSEDLRSFGEEYLSENLEDQLAIIADRVAKVEEERDTASDTASSLRQTLETLEKFLRRRGGEGALGVAESAELVADMQEINKAMSEAGLGVPGQKVSDAVVRLVEATTVGRSSTPKESPNAHARIPTPAGAPENQAWIVKTHLGDCIGIRAGDSWFAFSGHNYSVLSHDRITLVKPLGGTKDLISHD